MTYLVHSAGNDPPLRQYIGGLITTAGTTYPGTQVDLLIRWGNTDGDDSAARYVLNRRQPLADALHPGRATALMTRSGIRVHHLAAGQKLRVREYFRVHAFDCHLISLGRRELKRYAFQEIGIGHSKLAEKAVRYAYRALYSLGLDFGAVDVVVNGKGKLAVLRVDPQPKVAGRLADRYASAIDGYLSTCNATTFGHLRLGADPEFAIRKDGGEMIPASRFFPVEGGVGCDAIFIRSEQGGIVRPLAELRPAANESPIQVVRSLQHLMVKAAARVPYANLQFRAGSLPYPGFPIGGHIHFSGLGGATGRLLRALDTYLTIPTFLVENSATSTVRRPRYGFLGDQRPKRYGFEYRTPASWLISPRIALAVLALAKVIGVHYRQLKRDVFIDPDMVSKFYAGNKEPFYAIVGRLFDDLAELSTYREYAGEIAPLKQLISQRRQWSERVDIRRTWRVPISSRVFHG